MTIEGLIGLGALVGIVIGLALPFEKKGCQFLLIVPAGAIAFVMIWQAANADSLRSTSGLEYFFVPFWACLGALPGFGLGSFIMRRSGPSDDV